jgi:hypothetical protein
MRPAITQAALAATLSILAVPLFAADGVLIVEKTTTAGATQTNQVQLEAKRMRAESPGAGGSRQVFIFDANKQLIYMINPERKTYSEMTKADADRLGAQASGVMTQMQEQLKNLPPEQRAQVEAMMRGRGAGMPTAAPAAIQYKKTGTDKVGRWTCDKYDGFQNNQKVAEVCTVNPKELGLTMADFAVTQELMAFMRGMLSMANANTMFQVGTSDTAGGYSGVPVRRVSIAGSQQTVSEVTEVTRQTFSDATFAVPAGLTKEASPMLGGRGR